MLEIKSFEDYLKYNVKEGIIDFSMRCTINDKGEVVFYIHPSGKDGITADFVVKDNTLHARF